MRCSGENLRWSLFAKAKFSVCGSPVLRWRSVVCVSRGSWSLSIEEDDLAAEFLLKAARSGEFRVKETPRKNPAGLLAEGDDRSGHQEASLCCAASPGATRGSSACRSALNSMHAAQPMKLYQR